MRIEIRYPRIIEQERDCLVWLLMKRKFAVVVNFITDHAKLDGAF